MGGSGKGHPPILVHVFWLSFQNAFHLIFVVVSMCCYYRLFSGFLTNVSQFIFFDFCHISVCCCYHCGEKRLVNSIPLFYCNDNHDGDFWWWAVINIVIILGMWGRLPIPCGYGYCCHRDCNCCGLFFLHYHHGGMTPILVLATARKGGRGMGSIPPPTVVVGGMIVRQLWKILFHSSKFGHHISVWQL